VKIKKKSVVLYKIYLSKVQVSLKFCHPPELRQTFQAHEISKHFLTSPNEHTVYTEQSGFLNFVVVDVLGIFIFSAKVMLELHS
jgi:hypothetical protein